MKLHTLLAYIGQTGEMGKARTFWDWFLKHQNKYLFLNLVDPGEKERLMHALLTELHRYSEHLSFEIGEDPAEEQLHLIITAEGISEHFPAVELLTELAPAMDNWRVVALKPPIAGAFKIALEGREFEPQTTFFMPLFSENNPEAVALQVCYPDYTEEDRELFLQGTYLLLDSLLGERATTLDIHYLKVCKTPEDVEKYDIRPLQEVASYIAGKKKNRGGWGQRSLD